MNKRFASLLAGGMIVPFLALAQDAAKTTVQDSTTTTAHGAKKTHKHVRKTVTKKSSATGESTDTSSSPKK